MRTSRALLLGGGCFVALLAGAGCIERSPELEIEHSERDALSMKHVRSRQITRGLEVEGAELLEHFDAHGRRLEADSSIVPNVDAVDITPSVSHGEAYRAAKRATVGTITESDDGVLQIFAVRRAPTLAYRFTIRTIHPTALLRVTVDATSGDVLEAYDDLRRVLASGRSVKGAARTFEASEAAAASASWLMVDPTGAADVRTHTAEHGTAIPGPVVSSSDLDAWDTGPVAAGAAVDAHANARIVLDHLSTVHGRAGADGLGSPLLSTVHFAEELDNAFYDPVGKLVAYGDGGSIYFPPSAALDIVAHEIFHGVTEATARLRYTGQSGALDEALSDIFACFIEHRAAPDPEANWTIGERIARTPGVGIRDLRDPTKHAQPSHMSRYVDTKADNGGVHINSGIPAHAAYLMTMGGRHRESGVQVATGIGWELAEKVWYRAVSVYFLAATDFAGAATATLRAADDLGLSPTERRSVACAWRAVGVIPGDCSELPAAPAPTTTNHASESPAASPVVVPANDEPAPRAVASAASCTTSTLRGGDSPGLAVVLTSLLLLVGERRRRSRSARQR